MNRDEYLKMHAVEAQMWWYRTCHRHLLALWARHRPDPALGSLPILDAGCGTGGFLDKLAASTPHPVVGLDYAPLAVDLARSRSHLPVTVGSINHLPFADNQFAGLFSVDVLCHRSVDEAASLREFYRVLAPGGTLILNLPAYPWLYAAHDRAVHTARRYTAGAILPPLRAAGFTAIRTGYWNSILFPLMVVQRKLLAAQGTASDVKPYPFILDALFHRLTTLETFAIRRGLRLPFGGSLLVVARKHA